MIYKTRKEGSSTETKLFVSENEFATFSRTEKIATIQRILTELHTISGYIPNEPKMDFMRDTFSKSISEALLSDSLDLNDMYTTVQHAFINSMLYSTRAGKNFSESIECAAYTSDITKKYYNKDLASLHLGKLDDYALPPGKAKHSITTTEAMQSFHEGLTTMGKILENTAWGLQSSSSMFLQTDTYDKIPSDIDISVTHGSFFDSFGNILEKAQKGEITNISCKYIDRFDDDGNAVIIPHDAIFTEKVQKLQNGTLSHDQFIIDLEASNPELHTAYVNGKIVLNFYVQTSTGIGFNVELFPEGEGNGMLQPMPEQVDGKVRSFCYEESFEVQHIGGVAINTMTHNMLKHFYCINLIDEIGGDTVDSADKKLKAADRLSNILYHLGKVGVTPENLIKEIDASVEHYIKKAKGKEFLKGYLKRAVDKRHGNGYVSALKKSPKMVLAEWMHKKSPTTTNRDIVQILEKKAETEHAFAQNSETIAYIRKTLEEKNNLDGPFTPLPRDIQNQEAQTVFLLGARLHLDSDHILSHKEHEKLKEEHLNAMFIEYVGNGNSLDKESVYDMLIKTMGLVKTTKIHTQTKYFEDFKKTILWFKTMLRNIYKEIDSFHLDDYSIASTHIYNIDDDATFIWDIQKKSQDFIQQLYTKNKEQGMLSFIQSITKELDTYTNTNNTPIEKTITKRILLEECLSAYETYLKEHDVYDFVSAMEIEKIRRYYIDRCANFLVLKPMRLQDPHTDASTIS